MPELWLSRVEAVRGRDIRNFAPRARGEGKRSGRMAMPVVRRSAVRQDERPAIRCRRRQTRTECSDRRAYGDPQDSPEVGAYPSGGGQDHGRRTQCILPLRAGRGGASTCGDEPAPALGSPPGTASGTDRGSAGPLSCKPNPGAPMDHPQGEYFQTSSSLPPNGSESGNWSLRIRSTAAGSGAARSKSHCWPSE